jgi:hypothetical protein
MQIADRNQTGVTVRGALHAFALVAAERGGDHVTRPDPGPGIADAGSRRGNRPGPLSGTVPRTGKVRL